MGSLDRWKSAPESARTDRRRPSNGRQASRLRRACRFEQLEARLPFSTTPLITEFVASNGSTLNDGDGVASDWIEIHNPTDQTFNLAGWHLTDNASNLNKWTFPELPQSILDPGEYLIVFASAKSIETYVDPLGYLHTDFALSADGEYLGLTDPDENIIHEYAPTFRRQIRDVSYGLLQNATSLTLVGPSQSTSVLVPTNGALDAPSVGVPPAWALPTFNDGSWLISNGPGVGFDFGDDVVPTPANGVLLPGGPVGFDLTDADENGTLDGTIFSGGSSPGGEEPPKALDNTEATKWLAFEPAGTFYGFRFSGGQKHAVNGYTITSANDSPDRDPYMWTLSGSNDGVNYTVVDTRTAQTFANRFETRLYEFNSSTPYEFYRFDFQTRWGATGQGSMPNSIQMAEIELLSTGPVEFDPQIDLDVEAQWNAQQTSVYQRIEFQVEDPAALASLLLEMQYDDGFVAYLNGKRVASVTAPSLPTFQSNATGERDDADALVAEQFNLTQYLDDLVAGANVLAIHVLNVSDTSADLLSRAQLFATELIDDTVIEAYMPQPSPGAANVFDGVTQGPIIVDVTENVPQPAHNQNIVITAEVEEAGDPIGQVQLHYRIMYGAETAVPMNDSGAGSDAVAGDGVYTGVIPESAFLAGQMVRWYVTAEDTTDDASRYPLFINPTASPEYFGTVVQTTGLSSTLPIFEYFVENVAASATETGARGSVYYLGEFYDNVFVRRRGGNTTQGRKFEFNDGHHFLFDPAHPRVDEINLNERGAEPTYMRQVLSWEIYGLAGVPASIGEAWHTRLNGSYLDVRIFVEQPDSDLLRRTGLDENGAFYKIGADGVENSVTSSTNGVRKRTRKHEDNSDLQALVNGVNPSNVNGPKYVFDNIDIAAAINYIAATSIIHDNDHPHKNFHLYRDTEGSGQWTLIPWDKDLTFGLNFGISGIVGDQDPFSHPFFGDQEHQKIDGQWNRMIDALFDLPVVKEMYVRRLRTLMDQFILPPGAGQPSWIETRVGELTTMLQPQVGSSSWLTNVNRIVNEYLVERRQHLYVDHSINNPGYPDNAAIPNAQIGNPTIQFGQVEYAPASGNEDEEFIQLINPNATAVDISNWRLEGGIQHTFRPGTVIPAGGSLYVSPDVPTFLARTTGPRGGQQLFVQGNYSGKIANEGELIKLVAADNTLIASHGQNALPGDYNADLVVDDLDYGVWRGAFGTNSPAADGNGDGTVDAADYVVWRKNYGMTAMAAAAAPSLTETVAIVTETTDTIASESVAPNVASSLPPSLVTTGLSWQLFSFPQELPSQEVAEFANLGESNVVAAAMNDLLLAGLADEHRSPSATARDELFADLFQSGRMTDDACDLLSDFTSVSDDALEVALAAMSNRD